MYEFYTIILKESIVISKCIF